MSVVTMSSWSAKASVVISGIRKSSNSLLDVILEMHDVKTFQAAEMMLETDVAGDI